MVVIFNYNIVYDRFVMQYIRVICSLYLSLSFSSLEEHASFQQSKRYYSIDNISMNVGSPTHLRVNGIYLDVTLRPRVASGVGN